jgi:hypothetical protein
MLKIIASQVETMLNSRPIKPISNSLLDLNALAPGHFLNGNPTIKFPEADKKERNFHRLGDYERVIRTHPETDGYHGGPKRAIRL